MSNLCCGHLDLSGEICACTLINQIKLTPHSHTNQCNLRCSLPKSQLTSGIRLWSVEYGVWSIVFGVWSLALAKVLRAQHPPKMAAVPISTPCGRVGGWCRWCWWFLVVIGGFLPVMGEASMQNKCDQKQIFHLLQLSDIRTHLPFEKHKLFSVLLKVICYYFLICINIPFILLLNLKLL